MGAVWRRALSSLALLTLTGCDSVTGGIVGGTVAATLAGARSPSHELEQIYYLGIFDPHEQLPEAIYRITVKGQSAFLNNTKYASGWVPASVIDSLGGRITLNARTAAGTAGDLTIAPAAAEQAARLQTGRRLVLFGPEGFREAPRDYRLVIVMGASPHAFFQAIDTALGQFSEVRLERDNAALQRELMQAMLSLKTEQNALKDLEVEVAKDLR